MNIHNKKILDYIEEKRVVTSSEIAKFLKVSWNTADSYLKDLVIEGKIERIKKEGVNLWLKK
jgi:Mn-dependent DtxR family transcriptional regulator